jgi:hypothetical protein
VTRRGRYCTVQWTSHDKHFSVVKLGGDLLRVKFWNADFLMDKGWAERVG